MVDGVSSNFGALLLGGFFAIGLSGIVALQSYIYFKLYPKDALRIKMLVTIIWILDVLHTSFICAALWHYLIVQYGEVESIDNIHWTVALTIVCTAILTFFVHCFFAHRIFRFSKHNWWITIPIVVLAVCRLCSASVTTSEMIRLKTFTRFKAEFRWVFTLGLALSSAIDVIITVSLCSFLRMSRTEFSKLNKIVDTLMLYTFESGSITCAATIVSMICWLVMPHNLIFMGLHFVIGKLYANSLLVTLNTRKQISRNKSVGSPSEVALPMGLFGRGSDPQKSGYHFRQASLPKSPPKMQISVQKTVESQFQADEHFGPDMSMFTKGEQEFVGSALGLSKTPERDSTTTEC